MTTPQHLDERFRDAVSALHSGEQGRDPDQPIREGSALTARRARQLFDAQTTSRHLDLAARWLRSFNEGFYTVGSSGHEGDAAVAAVLRPGDPALLHQRSSAFYCVRAVQAAASVPGGPVESTGDDKDPLIEAARDVLRGVVASAADPIAGGRAKVFGRADLQIIPAGPTAAGHLPRALGIAHAIATAPSLRGAATPWAADALVTASFGDGASNHADALTTFNTLGWYERSDVNLPLLLVCEDNGWGGAVPSPSGWVAGALKSHPGVRYFNADGTDLAAAHDTAGEAAGYVRSERRPAVLHLTVVRLMGHSGADAETTYRSSEDLVSDLERDPLAGTARLLVEGGFAEPDELIARYDELGWQVRKVAEEVIGEPKLADTAEIAAPLAPRRPLRVARHLADAASRATGAGSAARAKTFDGHLPEQAGPLTLAQTVTATLTDALLAEPGALVLGPDVAVKGGTHGVTRGLRDRFGAARVLDTVSDETAVLGLALGAGTSGLLPVAELPELTRPHQLPALGFRSRGAFRNPMVVRVPAAEDGAQSYAVLRDTPGLVVAVPSGPADAAPLLRSCLAAAAVDGSVAVFLEPAGLYHTRDLYNSGDGEWLAPYAAPGDWAGAHIPIGRARTYPVGSAEHLTILTFGNGVRMSLRVAARLATEGYGSRVVDLRWLNPLPVADLVREASATGRVLIVDETRRSGGVGEGVLAALVDGGFVGSARRTAAADVPVPLGPAARHVLIGEDAITQGAHALLAR